MLPSQFTHEGTLANGWKAYEPNTSNARSGHIESSCKELETCFLLKPLVFLTASTAPARLWCKELPLQLGKFGLQLTQVVARSLVLLGLGHLGLDVFDLWCKILLAKDIVFPSEQRAPYPPWSPY